MVPLVQTRKFDKVLIKSSVFPLAGQDWSNWLFKRWKPCMELRKARGIDPPEPPITMTWSPFEEGDNRIKVNAEPPHNMPPHFIQAYGVRPLAE